MNINNLTAQKIKEFRVSKNITAETIANELGISKTAYSQLENGHTEITLTKIDAICKVFNVPIHKLLPNTISTNNTVTGNNNIIGGEYNTVNNYCISPEEKLQEIADSLNATIETMRKGKK